MLKLWPGGGNQASGGREMSLEHAFFLFGIAMLAFAQCCMLHAEDLLEQTRRHFEDKDKEPAP